MTSIETLDFTSSASNSNMVPINNNPSAPVPQPGHKDDINSNYDEGRAKTQDNNIDKEQMMELSTPLNEIMDIQTDPGQQQGQMQMMQQQSVQPQQQMFPAGPDPGMFQQEPQQEPQQQQAPKKANIGNLTDEQLDALLVGLAAAVAFSPQLQEKMVQFVPSLFNEMGVRTIGGTVATGVVAGGLFLLAKRVL
tara:strand:+ start:152 stop:730 length:579 start_codon:yes stop_codon:yes gene_type:complete